MRASRTFMVVMIVSVGVGALVAQSRAADSPQATSLQLEEVIVTAQKRAENVQNVPAAISVVSGAQFDTVGGKTLQDLTKLSPSLTIQNGGDPSSNTISMRGVGTFAFSIGVEPSVLVVVDDVANLLTGQGFSDIGDIERIEVLRGPQNTLFGKAASAGVINIVTKAPTKELTAKAELTMTNDNEQRYELGLSGPLSDDLSYRVNAQAGRYQGNVTELTRGVLINGRDDNSFRGKLRWQPSEVFDATLAAHYSDYQGNCCAFVSIAQTPGLTSAFGAPASEILAGITPGTDNFAVRVDPLPMAYDKTSGASLKMNWQLGAYTLSSITAWDQFYQSGQTDFDGLIGPAFGLATGAYQYGSFKADGKSQEFRLVSPSSGSARYVFGAYVADNRYERRFHRTGPIATADWRGRPGSKNASLFGQGEFRLADSTWLIAGLRGTREDIDFTFDRYLNKGTHPPFSTSGSSSENVLTGKLGLQRYLNKEVMIFATYSRGHKGAAYDLTSSFNRPDYPARNPVLPESSDNFELGLKGEFLNDRLVFNTTVFDTNYKNFQAQTLEPALGGSFILANVGSLNTRGVEIESSMRVARTLTLDGNLAYTKATIRQYPNAQCYFGETPAQGCITDPVSGANFQSLAGKPLANTPEWKFNVGGNLDLPMGDLPLVSSLNVNYTWQSSANFDLGQDPSNLQGAYGIANASLTFKDRASKRFTVTFFMRNLFDKHYYNAIQNNTSNFIDDPYPNPATIYATDGQPARDSKRYFGVTIGAQM